MKSFFSIILFWWAKFVTDFITAVVCVQHLINYRTRNGMFHYAPENNHISNTMYAAVYVEMRNEIYIYAITLTKLVQRLPFDDN